MSLFHVFVDPTYKLRVTENDGTIVNEVDMIQNYWFPSLPVFPDNYAPEAHNPGTVSLSGEGPWTVSLDGVFTDYDSMESAIVKTVTGNSDPDAIDARIVDGNLEIAPKNLSDKKDFTIDIKANSNGQVVSLPLQVSLGSSGINEVDFDKSCLISWDGSNLLVASGTETQAIVYSVDGQTVLHFDVRLGEHSYPINLTPGLYIVKIGSRTEKIMVK